MNYDRAVVEFFTGVPDLAPPPASRLAIDAARKKTAEAGGK